MAHTRIWIHAVWATKNHTRFLDEILRRNLFSHIRKNADEKGIEINFINGINDHVHCLLRLKADQDIAKVIQMIKGESSRWINLNKLTKGKFAWAVEYFAGSVSASAVDIVREYIGNQEKHHRVRSFTEEYDLLLEKYGLKPVGEGDDSDTPD